VRRVEKKVDIIQLSFFRLGARVTQAFLIHEHVRRIMASDDVEAMRHALIRLEVAYEALIRSMDLGSLKEAGQQLIGDMRDEWQWVSNPVHDIAPHASLGQKVKGLEVLIGDFFQSLPTRAPSYADWFNLGLELASTQYCSPFPVPIGDGDQPRLLTRSAASRTRPEWSIPARVGELCRRLNVQQDDVLPVVEVDGPYESTLPNLLPDCSYAPAWIRIEAGIARLSTLARDKPDGRRPKWNRDQLFLTWYEDQTSKATFRSPAGIRDKWNADNPEETVNVEVVKKAIAKARKDRTTS
jgi:hypothetical protein